MEVRLKTGYFGNRLYKLGIDAEGILLSSNRDTIRIPRTSITHIFVSGSTKSPGQFSLVTADNTYEGVFVRADEAKAFVETLCETTGRKYEINFTIE